MEGNSSDICYDGQRVLERYISPCAKSMTDYSVNLVTNEDSLIVDLSPAIDRIKQSNVFGLSEVRVGNYNSLTIRSVFTDLPEDPTPISILIWIQTPCGYVSLRGEVPLWGFVPDSSEKVFLKASDSYPTNSYSINDVLEALSLEVNTLKEKSMQDLDLRSLVLSLHTEVKVLRSKLNQIQSNGESHV